MQNGILDTKRKQDLMMPLIDPEYKQQINELYSDCISVFEEIIDIEGSPNFEGDEELQYQHKVLWRSYCDKYVVYEKAVMNCLQSQLEKLLVEDRMGMIS